MTSTSFWLLAALMTATALAGLLQPLLRKRPAASAADDGANLALLREHKAQLEADRRDGLIDEAAYRQAQAELARRVLDETDGPGHAEAASAAASPTRVPGNAATSAPARSSALAVALGVPVIALGVYQFVGTPQALLPGATPTAAATGPIPAAPAALGAITAGPAAPPAEPAAPPMPLADSGAPDVEAMVARLAQRLAAQPEDGLGWQMLARSYTALGRFEEASQAYARAARIAPDDAQLLADQADALAMAQGRSAAGEPTLLVERALKIDPDNLKALAIAGNAALERGDMAAAQGYFQRAQQAAQVGAAAATAAPVAAAATPASQGAR